MLGKYFFTEEILFCVVKFRSQLNLGTEKKVFYFLNSNFNNIYFY